MTKILQIKKEEVKTIGDVIKEMKKEGCEESVIQLHKNYLRHGNILINLKDLEELSSDLDSGATSIQEYMDKNEDEVAWSSDSFEGEEQCEPSPLHFDGIQLF